MFPMIRQIRSVERKLPAGWRCHNPIMKTGAKFALILLLTLVALVIAHRALSPYTAWYFRVSDARLTVNGKEVRGSLHRGNRGQTLFLTRRDKSKAESYMISIPQDRQGFVSNCGSWTAPSLIAFPIGDVNPPCWIFSDGEASTLGRPNRNLVLGVRSIEFTADDGSRITAFW